MTEKMSREEVLKLAKLARIEIEEDEAENLAHEFEAILQYVGEIKETKVEGLRSNERVLHNVMRDDINPHEAGIYTGALLNEAPARQKDFVRVKKIL